MIGNTPSVGSCALFEAGERAVWNLATLGCDEEAGELTDELDAARNVCEVSCGGEGECGGNLYLEMLALALSAADRIGKECAGGEGIIL